jgi:hypothetical protein
MPYVKPSVGSRVKVAIEGVVHSAGDFEMRLEPGVFVEWDSTKGACDAVAVEVLAPGHRVGDVASWDVGAGLRQVVMYMSLPDKPLGWYDAWGNEVFPEVAHLVLLTRQGGKLELPLKREES